MLQNYEPKTGPRAPEQSSPVFDKIAAISMQLQCAYNSFDLLRERLEPIRAVSPEGFDPDPKKLASVEPTELESQLANLLDQASRLSTALSELRGQLRI